MVLRCALLSVVVSLALGSAWVRADGSAPSARRARPASATKPLLGAGVGLAKAGQFDEAVAVLSRAVAKSPTDAGALTELGWAAFKAGKLELARSATERAVAAATVPSQRGAALYNVGRIAEAQGRLGASGMGLTARCSALRTTTCSRSAMVRGR